MDGGDVPPELDLLFDSCGFAGEFKTLFRKGGYAVFSMVKEKVIKSIQRDLFLSDQWVTIF